MRMFIMGVIFGGLCLFIAFSSRESVTEEMYSKQPNIDCNVVSKTILKTFSEDEFYINCESRKGIEVDNNIFERYQVKTYEKETLLYKMIKFMKNTSTLNLIISALVMGFLGSILLKNERH